MVRTRRFALLKQEKFGNFLLFCGREGMRVVSWRREFVRRKEQGASRKEEEGKKLIFRRFLRQYDIRVNAHICLTNAGFCFNMLIDDKNGIYPQRTGETLQI